MKKARHIPSTPADVLLQIIDAWEYREDKYELDRWLASQRLRRLHVRLHPLEGHLTIELTVLANHPKERIGFGRAGAYAAYRLYAQDLKCSPTGWRWLVAQAIRSCRRHLRLIVSKCALSEHCGQWLLVTERRMASGQLSAISAPDGVKVSLRSWRRRSWSTAPRWPRTHPLPQRSSTSCIAARSSCSA